MTAPTKTDLQTLDFADAGPPFVRVVANDSIDTSGLDFADAGQPIYAAGGAAAPPPGPSSAARPVCFVCC